MEKSDPGGKQVPVQNISANWQGKSKERATWLFFHSQANPCGKQESSFNPFSS
jgi:hypothetical protein